MTADSGLILLREADHHLGITESLARRLDDPRRQDRIRYLLVELLRERIDALAWVTPPRTMPTAWRTIRP